MIKTQRRAAYFPWGEILFTGGLIGMWTEFNQADFYLPALIFSILLGLAGLFLAMVRTILLRHRFPRLWIEPLWFCSLILVGSLLEHQALWAYVAVILAATGYALRIHFLMQEAH